MKEVMLNDIDILIARKISKSKAEKANILPFKEDEGKVYMLCEFHDENICKEMQFLYGCTISEVFINNEKLKYLINKVFFSQDNIKIEDEIIEEAIGKKASDLHLETYKDIVYVRVRIDGILSLLYIITKEEYSTIISRIKINSALDITEHRKPQDGKITMDIDGNTYDLRVSIIPVVFGEKIVLRILYNNGFNYCLDNLKLLPNQRLELEKIINRNTGLVIVNGPTGSGKSTTLYTIFVSYSTWQSCKKWNIKWVYVKNGEKMREKARNKDIFEKLAVFVLTIRLTSHIILLVHLRTCY